MTARASLETGPARRVGDRILGVLLSGAAAVLRALPSRWVIRLADALGSLVGAVDRGGARTAVQNMDVVFGEGRTPAEKRRLYYASRRQALRSVLLLLHASPLDTERMRRWVEAPDDVLEKLSDVVGTRGVAVSAHVGNWELLLGLGALLPKTLDLLFLAETMSLPAVDRFLASLRGSAGGRTALRKGGARALHRHVKDGGTGALLVDRNVRRDAGGIWAPFLGLQARTTPVPAWLAWRLEAPVRPLFCLPTGDGYRLEVGPEVTGGLPRDEEEAWILEVTARINRVVEAVVRAYPESWNWTLKRFKSRPHVELGAYPPYSLHDA